MKCKFHLKGQQVATTIERGCVIPPVLYCYSYNTDGWSSTVLNRKEGSHHEKYILITFTEINHHFVFTSNPEVV